VTAKRRARWAGVTMMASVLWLLAAGASAQGPHRPGGRNAGGGGGGPQRMMPAEQRPEQRSEQFSSREGPAQDGGNRLSPEERRQLRRDVHEAGRDLYSDKMPPGRREQRRQ
jgi:hypothetical protein